MRFVLTKELGKLARWLRILGFDATYFTSDNIGTLILQALRDDRIIITRKKAKIGELEKKTIVIVSDRLEDQLKEVIGKLDLKIDEGKMFTRCTVCNEALEEVKKENIKELIPEYVYQTQDSFMYCSLCQRVYWQGSHWGNVKSLISKLSMQI